MNKRLRAFQRSFQNYLVAGAEEATLSAQVRGQDSTERTQRLRVYRNAYYTRLEKALAHDFPATQRILGERSFARVAGEYVLAYPSRSPSLRDLGSHLAQLLQGRDGHELGDLAALEWAVHDVFDGPDAEPVKPDALEGIEAEQWAKLKLKLLPTLRLLETRSNAVDLWRSSQRGAEFTQLFSTAKQWWVVWRADENPRIAEIPHETFLTLRELGSQSRLERVCEALQTRIATERIADVVARAISQALSRGWVADVSLRDGLTYDQLRCESHSSRRHFGGGADE